jgi:hypothetical protein
LENLLELLGLLVVEYINKINKRWYHNFILIIIGGKKKAAKIFAQKSNCSGAFRLTLIWLQCSALEPSLDALRSQSLDAERLALGHDAEHRDKPPKGELLAQVRFA